MAEASSRRAAAISVRLLKFTFALPYPTRDSDDVPVFPERRAIIPSIFDVTSASTISGEAPGYENDTEIDLPASDGLYCTLSIGSEAMPITDSTAITNNTENDEIRLIYIVIQNEVKNLFFCKSNNTAPAAQTDSQEFPRSYLR